MMVITDVDNDDDDDNSDGTYTILWFSNNAVVTRSKFSQMHANFQFLSFFDTLFLRYIRDLWVCTTSTNQ